MARGNSGRIVLEIEPSEKQQLHFAVRKDGLTLKEWFIRQMQNYLQASGSSKAKLREKKRASNQRTK